MSKSLWKCFMAGLLTLVPAWATFLILSTLFHALNDLINEVTGNIGIQQNTGLSFALFLLLVLMVGAIATHIIGRRIITRTEQWIEQIPLVRSVYLTLKGMTDLLNFRSRFGRSRTGATADHTSKYADGVCAHGHPSLHRITCVYPRTTVASHQPVAGRCNQNGIYRRFIQA
jgi:type III secretory pathway component EscS